jgi:hypothetical protein
VQFILCKDMKNYLNIQEHLKKYYFLRLFFLP